VPPGTPLPEGSLPATPTPLTVTLPPNATPEQKREAVHNLLIEAGVPADRIEGILELLDVDDTGRVYITDEGMERLRELLDDLDIPDGAEGTPMAVFRAVLDAQGTALTASAPRTAIVFFRIPERFIGKSSDRLQVVKVFSSQSAETFKRVYSFEELLDGCAAVVRVKSVPGGEELTGVLAPHEDIDANSRLAVAIADGGRFDLDGAVNGAVVDPAFLVEGEPKSPPDPDDPQDPHGGSGCTAGGSVSPSLLLLLSPLVLLIIGRRM